MIWAVLSGVEKMLSGAKKGEFISVSADASVNVETADYSLCMTPLKVVS